MTTPLSGELADFTRQLTFKLDDFQRRACQALEDGHGVLVCAPTGAGKTVVGEFAVHLALAAGRRVAAAAGQAAVQQSFYQFFLAHLQGQHHIDFGIVLGKQGIQRF